MNPVHGALERVAAYFAERNSRQGIVARSLLGMARPEDDKEAHAQIRQRRARQRSDGSVSGDLVTTAWFVWEAMDLGLKADSPAVQRAAKWMVARQDKDGAYGLPPARGRAKRKKESSHDWAIGGFFAYRSSRQKVKRLVLPMGASVTSDQGGRFLASCFALRSVLRAGREEETLVRRHVGSLLHLPNLWDTWGGKWNPELMAGALSAIAWSPLPFRAQLPILAEHLAVNQKPDGSWRNLDIFHAVDALVSIPLPQARESVALAAPRLARMQTQSGAVGTGKHVEERTLVALRAWLIAREYA